MKHLLLPITLIVLSAGARAQGSYQTSPNGFLTSEGYQRAYIFGEWSNARLMFMDGEMRKSVMVFKGIALRHDQTDYYSGNGMGRQWSNVTLDISTCDINKISQTFSQNPTSTPSRVFSASVSFPTMTGYPASNPAAFSLDFPFGQTWINSGAADICLDFDFNGGVLANAGRWSTSWYETYYTDALNGGDHASGTYVKYGTGCTDSANSTPASAIVFTDVYTSAYPTAAYQNKYKISTRTRYTAPGRTVVHAVSLFGNPTGIAFPGVSCEKVYIDLAQPFFVFPVSASTTGTVEAKIDFPLIDYNVALEGIAFWAQAAWDDSSSTALKFSDAERTLLPPMPKSYDRWMIYQTDTTLKYQTALSAQGSLTSPFNQATHNPIFRYAQ